MSNAAPRTLRELPPLAGVCTPSEAMRPGLAVEECVRRLKRYHYAFKRLHQIMTARITAEPWYELKMGFSHHAYLCAEHVAALRKRVAELREPPLHLDAVPDAYLEIFFDEILAAPTTGALVLGLYEKAIPALRAALERHLAETNPLADAPSVRVIRFALLELGDMAELGAGVMAALVEERTRAELSAWLAFLATCLEAAGGLDGAEKIEAHALTRRFSAQPYTFDRVPKRDPRFDDPYNMGVNAEALVYDPELPPQAKIIALFVKRYRELDVPEMMASILVETPGKPWDYYLDMSRQLWDEARHGLLGQVGLQHLGIDLRLVPIPFVWSRELNAQLTPLERHAALFFIEQKLMAKTGKRYEWEIALASRDELAVLFQDYDWADEVLHSRIGRTWLTPELKSAQRVLEFGDQASLKVHFDLDAWQAQGLTEHRNWWAPVYRAACAHWGIEPDPRVTAAAQSYAQGDYSGPRFLDTA
jgi:hypothetical protein